MNAKVTWAVILVLLAAFVFWLVKTPGKAGKLDSFATCVKDSGALFYGAFWCPHCAAQKALFGSSAKYLPYIECSTPDGNNQLPICAEAGVEGYPTWKFPDGTVKGGEVSLIDLSTATNCPLPE
jgi:hypothetical protein